MSEYYRSLLTGDEVAIYDRILASWQRQSPRVVCNPCGERSAPVLVEYVARDHPEIFYVGYYQFEQTNAPLWTTLRFSLLYTEKEIAAIRQCLRRMKEHVGRFLPAQASDTEKVWLIFDYMSRQVEYGETGDNSHSVVGCLPEYGHTAVCEGMAKAFKFLCDASGIPCIVVVGEYSADGESGRHAWNIVRINGWTYRHIDVTAQIRQAHACGRAQERNFLKRDSEMDSGYWWDGRLYPACR